MVNQVLPDAEPIATCTTLDELMAQAKEESESKARAEAEAEAEAGAEAGAVASSANAACDCAPVGSGAGDAVSAAADAGNAGGSSVAFASELPSWSRSSNLSAAGAAIAEVESGHEGDTASRSSKSNLSDGSAASDGDDDGDSDGDRLSPTSRRPLRRLDSSCTTRSGVSVISAGAFCEAELESEVQYFEDFCTSI